MASWRCPKCKKRNDEGDTTCLRCGHDLPLDGETGARISAVRSELFTDEERAARVANCKFDGGEFSRSAEGKRA
jgi:hypothetical protein